ncbi:MAG TPA: hypothetical protein VGF68_14760 [Solirubrobacteraceae bacterium]
MTRRTRTVRYGASIAVALVGVVCGATIPGTAGGTAATVLVGIGLVGVVSLIFYEVGLTEDRERASRTDLPRDPGAAEGDPRPAGSDGQDGHDPAPPRAPGSPGEHEGGRVRPLDRRRGQRRRLR